MASTSTLKLPKALERRVAPLAKRAGRTPESWMVHAIAAQAELAEEQEAFLAEAVEVVEELDRGAPLYAGDEVHAYIRARVAGQKARRPRPLSRNRR